MKEPQRQRYGTEELAVVLSHYDLGVIESITEFNRGSRSSPKVGIVAQRGKFLLKKRAAQRRSARRVALAHAVQRRLAECDYPAPEIIATRTGENCTRLGAEVHELFGYIAGQPYAGSIGQTRDAGAQLGRLHETLRDFALPEDAPVGSFHDVNGVRTALHSIPSGISSHDSVVGYETDLHSLAQRLFDCYDAAADAVNDLDFASQPVQVVHGDWHPGNMLFKHDEVVAVMDYDSCRVCQRVVDVANGILQFSLISGGRPDEWPDEPDLKRLNAFLDGYRDAVTLTDAEWRCLPHLMIEALIGETAFPIAQTGLFGRWTGFGFLKMIDRKVHWLRRNAGDLLRDARGEAGEGG